MSSFTATFREQFPFAPSPLPIAESFGLMDFDSPSPLSLPFTVNITFSNGVDGLESEGLQFNTTGTNITVTPMSSIYDQFSRSYILEGGETYLEYQDVSCHLFHSSACHIIPVLFILLGHSNTPVLQYKE